MARTYRILHRPWRAKAPLYWGMIPELAGIIPCLVLFALQQPDAWRTLFWRIGYENQLNSNPSMILYAYANFRPLPTIPFVWTQTLTTFNVAISIVSLFVLLGKMIATIMKVYYPIFGTIVGVTLTALYTVSVYGQAGPDYADDRYPSPVAWYIRRSCDIARPYGAYKNCQMSKGAFAATVFLLAVYLFQTCFAIWAMLPNKELDMMDPDDDDDDKYYYSGNPKEPKDKAVELQTSPPHQQVPFTPRTQAFHALERKLPFRS